jgi:AcrR family transcriptional regulator
MAILEAEGLDAMSMRRVAAALGTGPASLYAHIANKEDLISILVDRAAGEVALPEPDSSRWQEQTKDWMRGMRAALVRHRNLARATMGMIPTGPNALASTDWLIGLLRGAGLPDKIVAYACDLIPLYVGAVAFEEGLWETDADPAEIDAYFGEIRDYFASLPPERYPNLLAILGPLMSGEGDERFEFGLDVLVAGLAALAARD